MPALKQRQARDLQRFAGKWVAFLGMEVAAADDSLPELIRKVRERGIADKVSVMLVPRKDEGPYILMYEADCLSLRPKR